MNSMSGIVNRPAAIQFGKSCPPPKTREELLAEEAEDRAVFNIEDIVFFNIPPTPNEGRGPLATQSPSADDEVGTNPASALRGTTDSVNYVSYITDLNPLGNLNYSINSPATAESPLRRGEADDGVGTNPTSALRRDPHFSNNLTPFNRSATVQIFRRTSPPPPDGSLPFMPMNLDESSFSNLHSPQETQRPRLMLRPRALHPDRNLAELLALNSSSESQNSRPGTPNSLPDQNPQNQPD